MRLLLIRHSLAEDSSAAGDFGRELSAAGKARMHAVVDFLAEKQLRVDHVLYSPRVRAVQTARILTEALRVPENSCYQLDFLSADYAISELISTVNAFASKTVAVVAHEPVLSEYASRLIGGGHLRFRPGTVACIDFPSLLQVDGGRLDWLLDPQMFD